MADKKYMNTRIQHKIDTSENWSKAVNFTPLSGELIVYSDLNQIKIGDGVTNVNSLPFMNVSSQNNEVMFVTRSEIDDRFANYTSQEIYEWTSSGKTAYFIGQDCLCSYYGGMSDYLGFFHLADDLMLQQYFVTDSGAIEYYENYLMATNEDVHYSQYEIVTLDYETGLASHSSMQINDLLSQGYLVVLQEPESNEYVIFTYSNFSEDAVCASTIRYNNKIVTYEIWDDNSFARYEKILNELLVVTIDNETHLASHSPAEILQHMQSSGTAVLQQWSTLYNFIAVTSTQAIAIDNFGQSHITQIKQDRSVSHGQFVFASTDYVDQEVATKTQVQIVRWEDGDEV